MTDTPDTSALQKLPDSLEICHAMIREMEAREVRQEAKIRGLEHQLEQLLKRLYGPRRDTIDLDKPGLFSRDELEKAIVEAKADLQQAEVAEEPREVQAKQPRKQRGRKKLPAHLPRERQEYDLAEDAKACSQCGQDKVKIREEVSEQLEYVPATMKVIEHARFVYACKNECEGEMATAPKAPQPIEKGLPGPGLLAHVVTSKYCDHLPLYRQEDIFKRFGVEIPRSTQCGWMRACADLVGPLYEVMKEQVLSSKKIHTDDTPVPVLDKGRGKTKTGRYWAYVGDEDHPYTVYDYTPTRKRDGPQRFLSDYEGDLQADAYGGYDGIYATQDVTEIACWAHVRRKFVEAQGSSPNDAVFGVTWIRLLYAVEREAREWRENLPAGMSEKKKQARFHAKREKLRGEKSMLVLRRLHDWLRERENAVLPKSPIAKAIGYALRNWDALTRYAASGHLEIDNNVAERAMRPVALGRKNWLFAGSDQGGKTAAVLYSLVVSAKRHGMDPFRYLRDVFSRISETRLSELGGLLPDRWKAAQGAEERAELAPA